MTWRLLAEGAVAINHGVPWVATNVDPTVPSPRGPLPGNGSLVAALRHATGAVPVVTGKPDPTMHRETMLRTGAQRPIVVGDRLDTDIEGANAVGCPSLLVFTGVTTIAELLAAPPGLRPSYVGADVGDLLSRQPAPTLAGRAAQCGTWRAERGAAEVVLHHLGAGAGDDPPRRVVTGAAGAGGAAGTAVAGGAAGMIDLDALDAVRALCTAHWDLGSNGDAGAPDDDDPLAIDAASAADFADPRPEALAVTAGDAEAAGMLNRLGLAG
jgi:hypothetical protein